jgi:hypothetical protein
MRRIILSTSVIVFAAFSTASSAQAQTQPQTTTASATISPAPSGHGRGIGVGAVTMLNGTSGALFTWGSAGGGLHVDGIFGLHHYRDGGAGGTGNYTTSLGFGARFWYHVHAASFADFSVGGGIGLTSWTYQPGPGGADDSRIDINFEVGAQIRAFIVPNVALIGDLGLGANFGADDNIMIGGHSVTGAGEPEGPGNQFVLGTLGIAYFFE